MDIWKNDPINSFRTLLRKLDNDYQEFDNSTQQLINKTFTKSIKDNCISLELKFKDENDTVQELPTGKEIIKSDQQEQKEEKKLLSSSVLSFVFLHNGPFNTGSRIIYTSSVLT